MGIGAIAFAVIFTVRQLRFGESVCSIEGKAGVLGRIMKGTVRTGKDVPVTSEITFLLQCVETYYTGSGKNRRTNADIKWQEKCVVTHRGPTSRSGIPFSFSLPTYAYETGYQLSRGDINWQLQVKAPVEGVDYMAMFIVPVFKVD